MISALYVSPKGHYVNRPDIDAWDEQRDARLYQGPHPVVAHPPCQLWVNLAAVNWKRYGRQRPAWYPNGSDGGCFRHALISVLTYGGVLEHPAFTHAWDHFGLMRPEGQGWLDAGGYWTCEVWQSAYGHRAQKRTWLLYASNRPPHELNWARPKGTHQVGWFDRAKPTLSKTEAILSPPAFAEELIALARNAV